jgi:uncharacterized protein
MPARVHRLRPTDRRWRGQRCAHCQAVQFPPRTVCRICRERSLEPWVLTGRGVVYSLPQSLTRPAPGRLTVLVQLEEGLLVTAQLTDVDRGDVLVGLPVEMVGPRTELLRPPAATAFTFRPILPRRKAS